MGVVIHFAPRQPKRVEFSEEISHAARRGLYFAIDAALKGLAIQGSKKCRAVVNDADKGLAQQPLDGEYSAAAAMELRSVLRARCALCPTSCGFVLPVGTA